MTICHDCSGVDCLLSTMLVVYYSQPAIYRSADSKNWTLIKWATCSGTLHFPALLHSFALLCYIWCVLVNSNCNLQAMETSSSFWSLAVSALHTVSNQDEVGLGKWLPLFCTSSGCVEFLYVFVFALLLWCKEMNPGKRPTHLSGGFFCRDPGLISPTHC